MQTRAESYSEIVALNLAVPLALKTSTNRSVRFAGTNPETGGDITGVETKTVRRFATWSPDQKMLDSMKAGQAWLNSATVVLSGPFVLLFSCFAEAVKNSRSGRYSYLY